MKITEEELHNEVAKALDFPLDKYAVKLLRKNKTSGRQGKNTGKAIIDLRTREQQQKVLVLDLVLQGQTIKICAALA